MDDRVGIGAIVESLRRPYPITFPMIALMLLVPVYLFLPDFASGPMHRPELPLDRLVPLQPVWGIGYGTAYLFLVVLPIFLVREREHVRRTFLAYLAVWIPAYVIFVVWPTEAPRPEDVPGDGFFAWGLRFLYEADPPYNCFPSLHVAHSFVSALTVRRLHRGVGQAALVCAFGVGLSTLFTKQHYVADVVAGIAMAYAADAIVLRGCRAGPDTRERRLAPALALATLAVVVAANVAFWVAYLVT